MPSRVRILVPAILLATSLTCDRGKKPDGPQPPVDSKPPVADGANDDPVKLAPVDNAQQLLPPDVQVLFEGKSIARAAEVFQREKVAKAVPRIYAEAAREMEKVFGVDVFVPTNLPTIGVDPNGQVGIALLDAGREAVAIYVKVTDPTKFREMVVAAAGQQGMQLSPISMGGAEVLKSPNGELAVVLREPFAVFVVSDKSEVDYARAIATMDPSQSLADSRPFRKATAGWVGPDALFYADFASLVEGILKDGDKKEMRNWAEDELANARKNGASADEIQRLEAQAKEMKESNERWAKRRAEGAALARFVLGDLSSVAMRIDNKRSGPVIEGRVQQAADAFPRSLVRNAKGAAPLTWALNGRPLFLSAGELEVDTFVDLVDRIARTEGETWGKLGKAFKKLTGVSLNDDVRPLLTGVAGVAATFDGDLETVKPGELRSSFGFAVHAKVKDGAQAQALIDKALPKLDFDGKSFKKDKSGGWSMDVEDYRKVYVKVAGTHVVVSTDPTLADRLKQGKPGDAPKKLQPASAYAAASLKGQAFTYVMDFSAFGSFFMVGSAKMSSHLADEKPKSRTVRKKLKELKKIDKEINKLQEVQEAASLKKTIALLKPFGSTALVAKETDTGFVVQGGQFIRARGLGDLIISVANISSAFSNSGPEQEKLGKLFDRRFQLEDEIRNLQDKDRARLEAPKKRR